MKLKTRRRLADRIEALNPMKKLFTFTLSFLLIFSNFPSLETASAMPASVGLPITAGSALLLDAATQRVIYAKAPHIPHPPASTTKVMTALVVLEKMPLDRQIRIPSWASSIEPSKVYLRPGEIYRVRDLVHAALISSANDAAEVLAVEAAGSRAKFAQWMNEKARRIGCQNTHFVNPSGLPPGNQYSTVYDLALIMREARKNPFIVDSMSRKYHTIYSRQGRKISLRNHNRLLWRSQRSVIGKTGYTRRGQHCFVGRIKWSGREVLVSLLGSHQLWRDLKVLLDYQFGVALYKASKNQKQWSEPATAAFQQALSRARFYTGKRDGKFGPQTVRAVELFQKKNGLPPNGLMTHSTCKKLTRYGLNKQYCR